MKAPVEGIAGSAWRVLTLPARLVAPAATLAGRVLRSEFWIETERLRPGHGPSVEMSLRSDVQGPRDGAGPLNHRTYRVHIADARCSPEDLIGELRRRPNDFSPTSFATFDPPPGAEGMSVDDELTVRLPGPWNGPIVVTDVEPLLVRFETLDGHMEAGWIRFTAWQDRQSLVFEIESLARSGDPAFDVLYHPVRVAKLVQTEMWVRVVEAAVEFSGGRSVGRVVVDTIIYEGPKT